MQQTGMIVQIISEFCYVKNNTDHQIYVCKAKGIFRHQEIKPVVGDYVQFEKQNNKQGIIYQIAPRKNELYRPRIANVDQVIIITAMAEPTFNSYLLNKYLAFIEYKDLKPVIVFTKKDLITSDDLYQKYFNWYPQLGYEVYFISNKIDDKKTWQQFEQIFQNKISVFTGQTGSGKSSTLNTLLQDDIIKTQEISKALGRGKHTTTTSALYELLDGMIADTPGFSTFDFKNYQKASLARAYHFFAQYANECKFRTCLHLHEPQCKIKALVQANVIPLFFYNDYVRMMQEQ
ncbi:ribosome small subunit-dependent GTPase A [Spiroplasma sp. SV19]|uniref:ribosome small subunit-dependent GTPase A n=1 Tax=Spiroplasma sp. SV19 TaxID=2570468 RepID=UPI0024B7CDC5|nr:ribosome small subunit-dependent GTPase A [Spiroplasma sp. SV19]WHQ37391.1 ribosome small subunit-dependent GTPase A [Spiroplasma sp. SV19]